MANIVCYDAYTQTCTQEKYKIMCLKYHFKVASMSQRLSYTLIRLYLVLCLPQINSKHVVDVFAILLLVLAHLDYGYSIMDIVLVP